jgi:uncharacterized membrane protein
MGRNEPLPESEPAPETPTAEVSAEVPEIETPTPSPTPTSTPESASMDSGSEAGMTMPAPPQTPQGTVQPEPQPTPASPIPAPRIPETGTGTEAPHSIIALLLEKAKLTTQFRKQKKLNKVMGLFVTKNKITNDEVEKLLHVSDATATRYLSELEKKGIIKQTGKTGKGVSYIKI